MSGAHPQITWTDIFDARAMTDDAVGEDTRGAENALATVRTFFGETPDWPPRLLSFLLNKAPWTYRWLLWLADSFERLDSVPGFSGLASRLRHRDQFDEALSVLQVAERLDVVGCQVAFEVPAAINGRTKLPDIFVRDPDNGTSFFCEVSVLFSAENDVDAASALEAMQRCFRSIGVDDLAISGVLMVPESKEELDGLIGRLRWEAMETKRDGAFREVVISEMLAFAFAPKTLSKSIDDWSESYGLQPNSYGVMPRPIDHTKRLRQKLAEKVQQLPPGHPNLLVIPGMSLFVQAESFASVLITLKEVLPDFPMISVLVLTATFLNVSGNRCIRHEDGTLFSCTERDGQGNQVLLVSNPAGAVVMPPDTLTKIQRAFSL